MEEDRSGTRFPRAGGITKGTVPFSALLPPKIPPQMGYVNEPSRIETEAKKAESPLGCWPCGLLRTSLEVILVPRAGLDSVAKRTRTNRLYCLIS